MGARSSQSRGPGLNKSDGHLLEYFRQTFGAGGGAALPIPLSGITATGGIISDYTSGSDVYRAHIFTSSGTFDVTAPGDFGDTVEYLVVAGGGGGGFSFNAGGGGGAGGLRTNLTGHPLAPNESPFPVSVGTYNVIVGSGGVGAPTSRSNGGNGTSSVFGPGPVTSQGGGGGGAPGSGGPGIPGGSGGGGGTYPNGGPYAGGTGNRVTGTSTPAPTQGNPGGTGEHVANTWEGGGGGGGAGSAGGNAQNGPGADSYGGTGVQVLIAGSGVNIGSQDGPSSGGSWFAGGGGGAPRGVGGRGTPTTVGSTDYSGGGAGGPGGSGTPGVSGLFSTGGGGGGSGWSGGLGGNGGSGIVVVRYQIGTIQTGTAKATGGAISYYDGKTYHTFTSSGSFQVTNGPISGETLIVAGGGGGGYYGGGGGAGGLLWYGSPTPTKTANGAAITYNNSTTYPISIGAGGHSVGPYSVSPKRGNSGTATVITHPSGPYSATEGGGGGGNDGSNSTDHSGRPGGSGGGASNQNSSGSPGPGVSGQGFAGGSAGGSTNSNQGGGGGGAGGAGTNGGSGSDGGIGLQFSTIGTATGAGFPGPGGGSGWFAGGGGGIVNGQQPNDGAGGGDGGPYAGGGSVAPPSGSPTLIQNGKENSGGGGASCYGPGPVLGLPGSGGSGIVIIAYPS